MLINNINIIKYRHSIITSVIFIVFAGLAALKALPISLFPSSSKPSVSMTVSYDFDIQEFKSELGRKIENSLLNLDKVERVEVTYQLNSTTFYVYFDWNKKPNQAVNDVTAVASFYQNELPEYLPPIRIAYLDAGVENYVVITSDKYDAKTLSNLLNDRLAPALSQLDGVLNYLIASVNKNEIIVKVNPLALIQHDTTLENVIDRLRSARFDINLGNIRNNAAATDNYIFLINRISSLDELRNVIITEHGTHLVKLSDVANIQLGIEEQDRTFFIGDQPAVAVAVWPKPEVNLYKLSKDFKHIIQTHVADVGKIITLNDPLAYINESLSKVIFAVILGALFSAVAIFIAFNSFRLTLLVSIIVPLSLISSIVILQILGVGLNIVSLGAMSVAIGLVVDNAVIMIDILVSKLKEATPNSLKDFMASIVVSVSEAKTSIIASSVTTIVVFLPLAFTLPIVYSLIGELAIVVVCILLFSIFISLFFLPAAIVSLCLSLGRWDWLLEKKLKPNKGFRIFYEKMILKLLRSTAGKTLLLLALTVLVIVSLYLTIYKTQREIVAEPQPNIIDISVSFNSADNSQLTREELINPIRVLAEKEFGDKIKYIFTDLRKTIAYISIHIKDYRDADLLMIKLRQTLKDTNDYSIDVSPWVSAKLTIPNIPDFRIFSIGESDKEKRQAHSQLAAALRSLESIHHLKSYPKEGQHNQLNIDINQSALNAISSESDFINLKDQVSEYIRYASKKRFLYPVKLSGDEIPLSLQLTDQPVQTVEQLGEIPIAHDDNILNLRHLLHIEKNMAWSQYYTRNADDAFMLEVWLRNPNDRLAREEINKLLKQLDANQNGKYIMLDPDAEIDSNIQSLIIALLAALILVVITLLILNRSIIYSAIILSAVPLGFMGAGFALFLFDSTVSVNSLVGLMLLTGLTINNVILITDKHYRYIQSGGTLSDSEIIALACGSRIRATTVTTFTTFLSLLPLALGMGSNGAIMQPLGISVASGLFFSLFFCLLLTPVLLQLGLPAIKRGIAQERVLADINAPPAESILTTRTQQH